MVTTSAMVDFDDECNEMTAAAVDVGVDAGDDCELLVVMAYYGHCVVSAMNAAFRLDGHDGVEHDPEMPPVVSVVYESQIGPFLFNIFSLFIST